MANVQVVHSTDLGAGLELADGKVVAASNMATDAEVAASVADGIAADNAVEVAAAAAQAAAELTASRRARFLSLVQRGLQNSAVWEFVGMGVKFYMSGVVNSPRLITMGAGQNDVGAANGYFNINMPAPGTTVYGMGIADSVVDANGFIQLPVWGTLYYKMPVGASDAGTQGTWHAASYGQSNFDVPDDFIVIGHINHDTDGTFIRFDGVKLQQGVTYPDSNWYYFADNGYFVNGESDYGGGYQTCRVCRRDNRVYVEGLANGNAIGHIATLPNGFRPRATHIFMMNDHEGVSRVDVNPDGMVYVSTSTSGHVWTPLEFSFGLN